jgi:iron complex outermembrane receptor protein
VRNAGGKTSTSGAFIEDDWTLGRLVLTAGGRIDRWTITDGFFTERNPAGVPTTTRSFAGRSGWRATGRVGALYRPVEALALRAAAYTGFRLPTLNELYRPFVVFPVTTQANENLGLEALKGVEAGADLTPLAGVKLSLTLFHNRLEHAIANVTIGTNLRQRQNVDAIVANGVELSAAANLGQFSLLASYAHSDSKVHASGPSARLDGVIPAQSPRDSASATLGWDHAGFGASTTLRYVGRQYEDDLQTDILPGAVTLDATAHVPLFKRMSLVGRAENIFDKAVVTRNQAGSIDLGTPRTLWLGIKVER